MVDELGYPDYVVSFITGAEKAFCDIRMIWVSLQLEVSAYQQIRSDHSICYVISDGGRMDPDLLVDTVNYVTPEWFAWKIEEEEFYPWPGFSE